MKNIDESVLNSIKKFLGIIPEDTSFDPELIMLINSVFMAVMQQWHGVDNAFVIHDETDKWSDFLKDDTNYEGLKTYVGLRVKLTFDPPTNASVLEAMQREIADWEWRGYIWKDLERIEEEKS